MSTTLPLFWHLSSASKKERIDASVKLVSALEQFQSQFKVAPAATPDSSEDEEEEDDTTTKSRDDLGVLNAQDVSYSIRRLIRGLASPRESSRLGFAVALTELLSRLDTVSCSQILNLITESTKHQGSMKGQEERDMLFARLFGIMSIIQSRLVVRTKPLPSSASSVTTASSLESYGQTIDLLVSLGEQKSWLRESAWFTLSLAVDALHESDVTWKEEAVERTLDVLFVKYTIWSTEKLALVLKLQNFYPERGWNTYLIPTFKNANILSTANLSTISRILKDSEIDEDGAKDPTKAPSGGWKPSLNFSWDIILEELLPRSHSKKRAKVSFQDFYKVVVDETLFSSNASANRKYWGFQVFQKALKRADDETVPMLFTKNFMRTWINHLSKKDRYLHKVSLQTAAELQTFVKDTPQLGFALIIQLTGVNGSHQFDKLTRTKTVESILSSMDVNGVQAYIDHLLAQVNESDANSINISAINARRAWIIEQLASLVRNSKIPRQDAWITSVLQWLTVHALFIIKKKSSKSPFNTLRNIPSPVFSDELRQSCRDKLLSCLGDLGNQTVVITEGSATRRVTGTASDGEYWISKVLAIIQELEEDKKHVVLVDEIDDEERALRLKVCKTIGKLKVLSANTQESARGSELLLLGALLMRYCDAGGEESDDSDALESCVEAVSNLLLTDGKKKKIESPDDDTEQPDPIDVLVDIVIGFLEKGTAYMRTIANQVFSLLAESVKATTIELILRQLERRDRSQLLNDDDDEVEDIEENEEPGSGEEGSDSEESSGESDDDDSGQDSNQEEADLELRNKIEEALRVNGIEPATGETDSEEELMDDQQMMAIDEQLAEVFRSRINEKKQNNLNAQRDATHFKNRVLDLVETYLKKQPSNPLVLRLIMPLVELGLGSGHDERQLGDKAKGILRACIGKSKESPVEASDSEVIELSKAIHALARKARSADSLAIISLCCIYLAKATVHTNEDTLVDLYKEDLHDFATRKNSGLNALFFQTFVKKYPSCVWHMRQDILDLSAKAINAYRQTQVIQLLRQLLNLLQSFIPPVDEVTSFMASLSQRLLELTESSCNATSHLTAAHVKELLQLALLGIQQTARVAPNGIGTIWKPEFWTAMAEKLSESPRFKSSAALKRLCNGIANYCETSNSGAMQKEPEKIPSKRRAEESTEESNPSKFKKQKAIKSIST